jgi:two-component system response regulator DesR
VKFSRNRRGSAPGAAGLIALSRKLQRDPLTPREQEVLRLIAKGLTYKEVAGELVLSPNTVRGYGQAILDTLNVRNRIEALQAAISLNLV